MRNLKKLLFILLMIPSLSYATDKWECVNNVFNYPNFMCDTWRLKVINGWMVKAINIKIAAQDATAIFVPDQNHEWVNTIE